MCYIRIFELCDRLLLNNKIEEENTKKLPVKKRYIFTSLAIIGALAAGYFIYDALGYQSTDDAYVETTTVSAIRTTGRKINYHHEPALW